MQRVGRLAAHLSPPPGPRTFSEAEVLELRRASPFWLVIHGRVYDVSAFADEHPGGSEILLETAALEAGPEFDLAGHSPEALAQLAQYYVGDLAAPSSAPSAAAAPAPAAKIVEATLTDSRPASHDSLRLRFALPAGAGLGLAVGQHVRMHLPSAPGGLARSYTPTSPPGATGEVEFVVKIYPDGQLTPLVARLRPGDRVGLEGPRGRLRYEGRGRFLLGDRPVRARRVGMVAGGTGVAPMLQVLQAALADPEDPTQFALLLGNKTEADVLLRRELEALEGPRFRLHHTLDAPPPGWRGEAGYVTAEMLERVLFPVDLLLVCGPPPLVASVTSSVPSSASSAVAVAVPVFAF